MQHMTGLLFGFLAAIGFFIAQVVVMALFNQRICG